MHIMSPLIFQHVDLQSFAKQRVGFFFKIVHLDTFPNLKSAPRGSELCASWSKNRREISASRNPASFGFRTADLQWLHGFVAGVRGQGTSRHLQVREPQVGKMASQKEGKGVLSYLFNTIYVTALSPIPFPHISPRADSVGCSSTFLTDTVNTAL